MENWGLSEWLHWQEELNPKEIDPTLTSCFFVKLLLKT